MYKQSHSCVKVVLSFVLLEPWVLKVDAGPNAILIYKERTVDVWVSHFGELVPIKNNALLADY